MSEIHPQRRTGKDRKRSYSYPDDRERKARAQQAAEALFAAKSSLNEKPVDQSALRPQVLPTAQPPVQPETIRAPADPQPPSPKAISAADLPRIRTWIKYGMTIAQVAAVLWRRCRRDRACSAQNLTAPIGFSVTSMRIAPP